MTLHSLNQLLKHDAHWCFTLVTDHKLLTTIPSPCKGILSLVAVRLQQWAIILSPYQYQIEHKCTKDHGNTCCWCLPDTAKQLGKSTRQDSLLSKVRHFTKSGWPQGVKGCLKPYWNRRHEHSVKGDCVLWGIWVIVLKKLQNEVLRDLHRENQGIARMKAIARSCVWWPGVDKCLENVAKNCQMCKLVKSTPTVAPLHPWV